MSDKRPPAEDETSVTPLSTMHGGKAVSAVDRAAVARDEAGSESSADAAPPSDMVSAALAGAQDAARGRPRPRSAGRARSTGSADPRRGGYSGAGPDEADPQLIGEVLGGYVTERGWEQPLAAGRVFADWAGLVGADVASHCRPTTLTQGQLRVEAESTAWATQLRLLSAKMLARLAAELGPDVVTGIQFTGPVGPSWKHGGFSVRGARGPRDTYG